MVGFWASCYIWVRYSDRKDIRVYQLCGPSVEAFGSADSLLCERHYRLFTQTQKKGTFPDGAILVTIEVAGLYTHIPHDEGLAEKLQMLGLIQKFPRMVLYTSLR